MTQLCFLSDITNVIERDLETGLALEPIFLASRPSGRIPT